MPPVHSVFNRRWATLLLSLSTLACPLAASAGQPADNPTVAAANGPLKRWNVNPLHGSDAANAVLMRAISLVGTPYVWGGTSPDGGFDCSGLVNYVFRDMLDLQLPRTSRELAEVEGPRIALDALQTGDLIFFGSSGHVSHVGIYVGDGRFIHAPRTGSVVRLEKIDTPYWLARYTGSRRVIDP